METLGIDVSILVAQTINFLIVLFVLNKLLYKPVIALLDKRAEEAKQSQEATQEIESRLAQTKLESEKILAQANTQAAKIINDARQSADEEKQLAQNKTLISTQNIIAQAHIEADAIKQEAYGQAKSEAKVIIISAIDKVLGQKVGAKTREEITTKSLGEIK